MDNKYLWNMGLAFDEEGVLKKMSKLAEQGWFLCNMSLLRYKFEKGEPKDLIYSMDFKNLKEDKEEYFELFDLSGWQHMCSYGPYHFFSAPIGTVPIYTDKKSYLDKYKAPKSIYLKTLETSTVTLLIAIISYIFLSPKINNSVFNLILFLVGAFSFIILLPSLMVTVAFFFRSKKEFKTKS